MLKIKNLYTGYEGIDIVKDINVEVNQGENLCIVGPNGCGKSTLLKSIANIIDYKGSITINGEEVSSLNRKDLAMKVGLMSQVSSIYFPYSVYETVSLGRYCYSSGVLNSLSKEDKDIILDSINKVGLLDVKDKMIDELSGGQLQRVFLARLFAQNPDVILLDEPTNHLDLKHQIELLEHLNEWTKVNKKIVVSVLHDLNLVQHIGDKVLLLNKGEILDIGSTDKVLNSDNLKEVYQIDIKDFMINILRKWE